MKVKFERCKKIFSMFLIIVLLFGILPVSALQGNVSDSTTSRIVKEIVEMREESVKYFICEDGSYIAATYSSPVHYEESGKWEEIDNTLTLNTKSGEAVYSTKNGFDVTIPQNLTGGRSITATNKGYTVSFKIKGDTNGLNMRTTESVVDTDKLPSVVKMNDTVKINVAKVLENALCDMKNEKLKSTERLFELFGTHLKIAVNTVAKGINLHIDHQAEVTPELIMNLMMQNTIETGRDISECAGLYTIGVDGAGLAVAADSFGALQERVEKEKILTWDEVYKNLDNNFEGVSGERVRLILNSSPKYCGGNTVSDKWARRITDCWVSTVRKQEMPNGRQLLPGWFSWARTIEYGSAVGATPNGRRNGEPISHGANPNPHFRVDGAVTAQSNGIAAVQCGYGNTAPLQLEFDPKIADDAKGVELIGNLIMSHFKQGGTLININVLDGEKLLAANKNPDLYPDLVVRVTGFTAYFVSLSPEFRQLVVNRFLEGM